MEKKSNGLPNVLIYFFMVLLVLIVAAPPIFRIVFKEEEQTTPPTTSSGVTSATALTCQRDVVVGQMTYNVKIVSNYGNDVLNKVTFVYTLPTVTDETVIDNPVVTEMNTIRNSGLVTETNSATDVTFVLTREMKEANPANTSLDNYFNPLETQRTNLETLGYSCSQLTA